MSAHDIVNTVPKARDSTGVRQEFLMLRKTPDKWDAQVKGHSVSGVLGPKEESGGQVRGLGPRLRAWSKCGVLKGTYQAKAVSNRKTHGGMWRRVDRWGYWWGWRGSKRWQCDCDLSREYWLLLERGWGKQVKLLIQKRQSLYGLWGPLWLPEMRLWELVEHAMLLMVDWKHLRVDPGSGLWSQVLSGLKQRGITWGPEMGTSLHKFQGFISKSKTGHLKIFQCARPLLVMGIEWMLISKGDCMCVDLHVCMCAHHTHTPTHPHRHAHPYLRGPTLLKP